VKPTVILLALTVPCLATEPASRPCAAGVPLGTFQLLVQPPGEQPLPIRDVNRILPGYKLLYRPSTSGKEDKGKLAVIISNRDTQELQVLDAERADQAAEWTVPVRINILGVVYGPQGLDTKKVDSALRKDDQMVAQLADYAEQTANAEALIEALSAGQTASSHNLGAAINGFAARYGGSSKLDSTQPLDQQALLLVRSINPALSSYDPLAAEPRERMQQSAGLAASVAGLFFGNTVGLAAGGASLFLNLRTLIFPDTDLRSSFAQLTAPGKDSAPLALCARREAPKARTRLAYVWAMRLTDAEAPAASLPAVSSIPAGLKASIPITASDWRLLERARDWQLEREGGATAVPVVIRLVPDKRSLELDLTRSEVAPGRFSLSAAWDWKRLPVPGEINIRPLPDHATIPDASADKLVSGTGLVTFDIAAPDLEFTEKVLWKGSKTETPLEFKLAKGPRGGVQESMSISVDSDSMAPGSYTILLAQPNGRRLEVPVRLFPPNPVIRNLPWRVNLGESSQAVILRGTGLDRILALDSPAMEITMEAGKADERLARVHLRDTAVKGDSPTLQVHMEGLHAPLTVPNALSVAGPRPVIASVQFSLPGDTPLAARPGELPVGVFAGISICSRNLESSPVVHLACGPSRTTITPGESRCDIRLSEVGPDIFFLSFDPSSLGPAGCTATASIEDRATGNSDAYRLGRVVLLPRIESFQLTDEKIAQNLYLGLLTGFDLELVEKTGWNDNEGFPVQGLPTPIVGEGQKQSLKIALAWPPPIPRAPLYVWLHGDSQGRVSKMRY
jgi:hypothetical protein